MRPEIRAGIGIGLIAIAVAPPVAGALESSLVSHVLGQYALLVGGGALLGQALARSTRSGWSAAPALVSGVLALLFWLLPRWIDAALAEPATDAAKAATLVLLAGLPLGWGWALAGPVLRGFAWTNAAAMLAIMGWLQLSVPQRLCNSYLLSEQTWLGRSFLGLAALVLVMGAARAVTHGRPHSRHLGPSPRHPEKAGAGADGRDGLASRAGSSRGAI